jgi:hypothetical protein
LREKAIPFLEGKLGVYSAENGYEMILEGSDGAFRRIDSVDVRGNTLELNVVFLEGGF